MATTVYERETSVKDLESALYALADFLEPVVQSNYQLKLCWFASTMAGWSVSTFHSLWDNKGPTVTIVRGDIYASLSWGKWIFWMLCVLRVNVSELILFLYRSKSTILMTFIETYLISKQMCFDNPDIFSVDRSP